MKFAFLEPSLEGDRRWQEGGTGGQPERGAQSEAEDVTTWCAVGRRLGQWRRPRVLEAEVALGLGA
jgi:hypothetical protein